jgi:hypothetical protein
MALTNHVLVRLAAARCGYEKFERYHIIGDDVVIFNYKVANSYITILDELKIGINSQDTI